MKEWIESHPYITGGAVLGVLILFLILRGGSSSSSQSPNTGVAGTGLSSSDYTSLQEAQLSSGAQLQAQQTAANTQISQYNAQVVETQIAANAKQYEDELNANTNLQSILTGGQVTENTNDYAYKSAVAQIGGRVQLAGIQANEADVAQTTQAQTLQVEYEQATKQAQITSDAQTAQAQANADTQKQIADDAALVQLGQITTQQQAQQIVGNLDYTQILSDNSTVNHEISAQESEIQGGLQVVQSGVLNKGGQGGTDQTSAFNTLFGAGGAAPPTATGGFGVNIPGLGSFGVSNP